MCADRLAHRPAADSARSTSSSTSILCLLSCSFFLAGIHLRYCLKGATTQLSPARRIRDSEGKLSNVRSRKIEAKATASPPRGPPRCAVPWPFSSRRRRHAAAFADSPRQHAHLARLQTITRPSASNCAWPHPLHQEASPSRRQKHPRTKMPHLPMLP